MLAKVYSGTTVGLDGVLIDVEVDVANKGFPTFTIVGLPNKAIDEAKDRVRTAIVNASFEMPDSRLTVNLAPADLPKVGSSFDLPIAVGILVASGVIGSDLLKKSIFVGELSLEGKLRRIPGVISVAAMAREKQFDSIFIPVKNAPEAALVDDLTVFPVFNLLDLILHMNGQKLIAPYYSENPFSQSTNFEIDFGDVKGQEQAKRALEIAAAGFHNVHLKGPPGTGKTLISRAFPSILPEMEKEEVIETSKIYSIAGLLTSHKFITTRPFRSPHHTTSRIGLIGGGSHPSPGEISLAHRGVLFLDEFPEFPRSVLESLRQPLEDGVVTVSRASGSLTFPSRFLLLAASNPCPCGYLGHPTKHCRCLPGTIIKYQKRISGPLLDRIDLHIDVPVVEHEKLLGTETGEASSAIRERVDAARTRQKKRFTSLKTKTNGEMTPQDIKQLCVMSSETKTFLRQAISRLSLSARSYFKVIKVSQTIADLEGNEAIQVSHIAEALQFRRKEE